MLESSCLAQLEIKFISRQKTNGAKKLTCPELSGGANLSPAADRTSAQSEGVLAQCNCALYVNANNFRILLTI